MILNQAKRILKQAKRISSEATHYDWSGCALEMVYGHTRPQNNHFGDNPKMTHGKKVSEVYLPRKHNNINPKT